MAPSAMPACLPGLKPNWESSNWGSRSGCSLRSKTVSNTLNNVHNKPIGRWFAGSVVSLLGFATGVTIAQLQLCGMSELLRMSVKRSVMYSTTGRGACLRNSEGIRSMPWAFLGASF
eukprot:300037-Amphidinium_carterae.4